MTSTYFCTLGWKLWNWRKIDQIAAISYHLKGSISGASFKFDMKNIFEENGCLTSGRPSVEVSSKSILNSLCVCVRWKARFEFNCMFLPTLTDGCKLAFTCLLLCLLNMQAALCCYSKTNTLSLFIPIDNRFKQVDTAILWSK